MHASKNHIRIHLFSRTIKVVIALFLGCLMAGCATNSGYGYGVKGGSNLGGGEASFGMAF